MDPIKTRQTNMILGAPKDWNSIPHGPCYGLPVTVDKYGDKDYQYHSFWEVTWGDRIKILLGYPIRLTLSSSFHPPVSVDVPLKPSPPKNVEVKVVPPVVPAEPAVAENRDFPGA